MTGARTDDPGQPLMRIADGDKVVAVFARAESGAWEEVVGRSKAQHQFLERRDKAMQGLSQEDRHALQRGDHAHMRGTHLQRYVGRKLWGPWHPDWSFDEDPRSLPGYREMYDFGPGRNFRVESQTLYWLLDQVWKVDHSSRPVQLSFLRRLASERGR